MTKTVLLPVRDTRSSQSDTGELVSCICGAVKQSCIHLDAHVAASVTLFPELMRNTLIVGSGKLVQSL